MSADDLTLEFRNGRKVVPDYLYAELAQLDTHAMTYDEAVKEADRVREARFVGDALHQVQVTHFTNQRRGI
jgi:hypothetical protein